MRQDPDLALVDLLDSLAALGRSMGEALDPRRFLGEFSSRLQRLLPHDRLVVDLLDDGARTFTVFAEHVVRGTALHEEHYTTSFAPEGRYVVEEWAMRPVFQGETLVVADLATDPRFSAGSEHERKVREAGIRSALVVPLSSAGRVIGALAATSFEPTLYAEAHVAAGRRVAELIAPFLENLVLLERERRRRRRLRALEGLTRALGASLDVRGLFEALADAVRPALDFDVMGVALLSESGRDAEMLAEVADFPTETPARIPLEHFSFAAKILAGEFVLIHDACAELQSVLPGDALIVNGGGRSCLSIPLWLGERVGGALYFGKRRPSWYDGSDVEIARGVGAQLVLAVQHQRLAEDARRLAHAEGRARRLAQRVESLQTELAGRYGFEAIIGRAPSLREALVRAAKVAPTDTTVLITGESGTGKELVAHAIHHASLRADGPFVAINCAALPETLLESELFGHERGAFTSADRQKPGRFELAAGGTLFLDEVAELSPPVQAKLLRVLQERQFERLGGTATLRADVRLIAATNRDLEPLVDSGRFRADLYYRLNVLTVHLPALRDRGDDVLLLAEHFVRELGARMGKAEAGLSRDAREALLVHPWRGNIRELQNAVERALILSDGGLLAAAHFGIASRPTPAPPSTEDAQEAMPEGSLPEWEKRLVVEALRKARGNRSRAAKQLGLTRSQLYTRLKRFGI